MNNKWGVYIYLVSQLYHSLWIGDVCLMKFPYEMLHDLFYFLEYKKLCSFLLYFISCYFIFSLSFQAFHRGILSSINSLFLKCDINILYHIYQWSKQINNTSVLHQEIESWFSKWFKVPYKIPKKLQIKRGVLILNQMIYKK